MEKKNIVNFPKKKSPTPMSEEIQKLAEINPDSFQDISYEEDRMKKLRKEFFGQIIREDKTFSLSPCSVEFRKIRNERGKLFHYFSVYDSFSDYRHEIHITVQDGEISVYDYSTYTEQRVRRDREYATLADAFEEAFLDCEASWLKYRKDHPEEELF